MTRIVVIEDETIIRENIAELLEISGFESIQAENGYVGVQKIIEHQPDLVVCDIMMPGLNGYQVLETIRKSGATASIPFIFLTAMASPDDIRKGMSLGADDYLTKPFSKEDLITAVESRINKQKIHKDHIQQQLLQFKTEIGNVYSHELNTPLNGILGVSELLIQYFDDFSKDEIREMIQTVNNSGKRLHRTVNNMLFYVQMLKEEGFLLNTPGEETESAHFQFAADQLAESYKRPEDLITDFSAPVLAFSKKLLDKIVLELLDNAFKFSEKGQKVRLLVRKLQDEAVLEIQDEGCGMKHAELENIQAFQQYDRNLNEQQGMGLGLFFVIKILEKNNIAYKIDSKRGKGTSMRLYIPLAEG